MSNSTSRLTTMAMSMMLFGSNPLMAADCGPGSHWIDSCPAGSYSVDTILDVTIKEQPCDASGGTMHHVILQGQTQFKTEAAQTDELHEMKIEIVSRSFTGDGYLYRAGINQGLSQQSRGLVRELGDPNWARLYLDLFFEIKLPNTVMGGTTLHNNEARRIQLDTDKFPPSPDYESTRRVFTPLHNATNVEVACFIESRHRTSVTPNDATFTASVSKVVNLRWESVPDLDQMGFFVWRGQLKAGKTECVLDPESYTEVKRISKLVPLTEDLGYSYLDNQVESGNTYCYALEKVDLSGNSSFNLDDIASVTVPH